MQESLHLMVIDAIDVIDVPGMIDVSDAVDLIDVFVKTLTCTEPRLIQEDWVE